MDIVFLSAEGWKVEKGEVDTVSLLVNGHVMVDTGWHAVHNLLREDVPVEQVDTLLLTHLHQDHRMGLPAMLFYLFNAFQNAGGLTICGVDGVEDIVRMALEYAGHERDYPHAPAPDVLTLSAGMQLETDGLRIETAASHHAVPGLMYRFTDDAGHIVVYTGDTAPSEETIAFARGADVLIHEHSWGAVRPEDNANACGHSSAQDAARIAKAAGAGALWLVHAAPHQEEEALKCARAIFPNTFRAHAGERIQL